MISAVDSAPQGVKLLQISSAAKSSSNMNNIPIKNIEQQVGSYAIATFNFDEWAKGESNSVNIKSAKKRGVKEVIHKVFADCAEITKDPYWSEKFRLASYGKFPRGFTYANGYLCHKKGSKIDKIDISNNIYETAEACVEFFRNKTGLFSPLDVKTSTDNEIERSKQTSTEISWSLNKKVQQCLLSNFIIKNKNLLQLSTQEVEQLRETLKVGISNKLFDKNNIIIVGHSIIKIDGLCWNPETRLFFTDPTLKPSSSGRSYSRPKEFVISSGDKDKIPQYTLRITKYLDTLEKKIALFEKTHKRVIVNNSANKTVPRLQLDITSSSIVSTLVSTNNDTLINKIPTQRLLTPILSTSILSTSTSLSPTNSLSLINSLSGTNTDD